MERKFVLEAIKIALIASIKEQMPNDDCKCGMCNAPFHKLHRVNIRVKGIGAIYLCEMCIEELREYFQQQERSAFDSVFMQQISDHLANKESSHIEEDFDDWGSLYAHAMYAVDHE
jgi:CRISPR/Cas system-associated protein Cas10 (large subunit of type III CRISPR-Cas system)